MSKPNTRKARSFTSADRVAATHLRALWDAAVRRRKAEGVPLTQDLMAERMHRETGKGTQSLVAQYLNGKLALNYKAIVAFSNEIGCRPEDIRSDLPEQRMGSQQNPAQEGAIERTVSDLREDVQALTVALGTLFLAMKKYQPVEAKDALKSLRRAAPASLLRGRVLKELAEALDEE
jgi:hypothetical protein